MRLMIFLIIFFLFLIQSAWSSEYYSFKKDQLYMLEGRWIETEENSFFKILEGTGNEENIKVGKSNSNFQHLAKYRICLKIRSDCHLNCEGLEVQKVNFINPWESPLNPMTKLNGSYLETKQAACKKSESKNE